MKRLVLAALVASLAGDALLLSPSLFLPGLVAFLIAHVFYIAAFSRRASASCRRASRWPRSAPSPLLVLAWLWPGVGRGLAGAGRDLCRGHRPRRRAGGGRATVLRDRAAIAVAAGAILFMLSDMTLALDKFGHVGWPVDLWTLPTYYLAQGLIAFCVLPRASFSLCDRRGHRRRDADHMAIGVGHQLSLGLIQDDQFVAERIANACATANRQVEWSLKGVAARTYEGRESLVDVAHENIRLRSNVKVYDQFCIRLWKLEADRFISSPQETVAELIPIERNRRFEVGDAKQMTVDFSKQRLCCWSCIKVLF